MISLQNKTSETLTLQLVQPAADWAVVKLKSTTIKPGGTASVEINVRGPYQTVRETSVTFEAKGESNRSHRATLAIRTGPEQTSRFSKPSLSPASGEKSNPPPLEDPLKLKGIEPRIDRP